MIRRETVKDSLNKKLMVFLKTSRNKIILIYYHIKELQVLKVIVLRMQALNLFLNKIMSIFMMKLTQIKRASSYLLRTTLLTTSLTNVMNRILVTKANKTTMTSAPNHSKAKGHKVWLILPL